MEALFIMVAKHSGTSQEIKALDAYITLRRAGNTIAAKLNRDIIGHKLTAGQFGILEALFHLGPLSQQTLAKKILSSKGNITMIIDNLEKQTLVKRTASPDDRRTTIIQLTPTGKKMIGKIIPGHLKKIISMMSALTLTEMTELKRLCKKVGLSNQLEKTL